MADPDRPGETIPDTLPDASAEGSGLAQRAMAPFSEASNRIDSGIRGLAHLVKLEVVVTTICIFIPLILLYGDDWTFREHISGYYAMSKPQYFYFPLTVAAMLFVVNGVVREKHWYNVGLGLSLAVLIFFNHVDHHLTHNLGAGAFFLGNAFVFATFTPKKELWFKVALASLMMVGLAGHFLFDWYSLFVAETLSLWVIAVHFILEAKGLIR
ncbi:hypothetical protein ACFL3S_01420 [Gemmatimonadota bacterium]